MTLHNSTVQYRGLSAQLANSISKVSIDICSLKYTLEIVP